MSVALTAPGQSAVTDNPALHQCPYLEQLLLAYLNSDYTINGPERSDAVAAYARDEGWLDVVAARADIRRFGAIHGNDLDAELDRRCRDRAQGPDEDAAAFLRWLDETLATRQASGG
jgi:hypothetical protein